MTFLPPSTAKKAKRKGEGKNKEGQQLQQSGVGFSLNKCGVEELTDCPADTVYIYILLTKEEKSGKK